MTFTLILGFLIAELFLPSGVAQAQIPKDETFGSAQSAQIQQDGSPSCWFTNRSGKLVYAMTKAERGIVVADGLEPNQSIALWVNNIPVIVDFPPRTSSTGELRVEFDGSMIEYAGGIEAPMKLSLTMAAGASQTTCSLWYYEVAPTLPEVALLILMLGLVILLAFSRRTSPFVASSCRVQ